MSNLRDAVLAHYDNLRAVETPAELLKVGYKTETCPLCQRFLAGTGPDQDGDESDACQGCPVALNTGESHCVGSPHYKVSSAAREFIAMPTPAHLAKLKDALRVEQDFLAGLYYPPE